MTGYRGWVPPCGIDCNGCPRFKKGACAGAETGCRQCKTLYGCCVEKKDLTYCHECASFPCRRFRDFAATWQQYGQDLIDNQRLIRVMGSDAWRSSRSG